MTREELIAALEKAEAGSYELSREVDGWLFREHHEEWKKASSMAYTQSVDAALTLVPEGWRIYMERKPTEPPQPWFVTVRPHAKDGWDSVADSPALALCIAALKARA